MGPAPETVKRAPTMDSEVEEEAIVPPSTKKQKVDDKEDDGGNIDSDSDEDMHDSESEPDSLSEPEWDVDSYDGREYIPDSEDRELFDNDEEYEDYNQWRAEIFAEKGFVSDKFNGIWPLENVKPAEDLVFLCIDKFNKETGKNLEYVSTVSGNLRTGAKFTYYMTIMARECPNGPPVEYRVKAIAYAGAPKPPVPIFCRPSPKRS